MTALRNQVLIILSALLAVTFISVGARATETIKVPTKRIIVPEEKSGDTETAPGEDDGASDVTIPDDAMPNLDLKVEDKADDTGDEPASVVDAPPPEVLRDFDKLPEPVRRMRSLLIGAAKTGDIEKLRSLVGIGETQTTLSIGGLDGDPIKFLKEASGDDEGYEILAILLEVLEAGFVHVDDGTEEEMYVWPYFFAWPLDKLSPPQKIELFRILTAGDVQDSNEFGAYIFYRVGIKPDGQWAFFVAGD